MLTHRNVPQSRRHVQRRFPPGSFIIDGGHRLSFVVGWGPTPATLRPSFFDPARTVGQARSWVAYVISDDRLITLRWEDIRDCMTIEEWENLE